MRSSVDGKGLSSPISGLRVSSTDPETHTAVDNQWWRAVGCEWTFHEAYPTPPYSEDGTIQAMSESQPGWAIQISGDDLSKDGKVTLTVARTTQHLEVDAMHCHPRARDHVASIDE